MFEVRGEVPVSLGELTSLDHFQTFESPDLVVEALYDFDSSRSSPGDLTRVARDGSRDIRAADWAATFDFRLRVVKASLSPDRPFSLTSLLKTALQLLALETRSALVFHASAVERDGEAFVFCGRSGSGKTTAAFLSQRVGATILAEEMVFVGGVTAERRPDVWTRPFYQRDGTRAAPRRVPVRRMFALEQGTLDAVDPLSCAEQVRRLVSAATIGVRSRETMDGALDLACALAERVPVRVLRFRKMPDFWAVIDDDLKGDASGAQ